jgi:DNA-binding beta-propeller fold protein YncE
MNYRLALVSCATALLLTPALARTRGKVVHGVERLLYIAEDRGAVSVYDIQDGHRLLRRIELPETGAFKGIAASPQLGKLYLTSHVKDELLCMDLETERIDWRRHYQDGYADSHAITPDGRTIYLPLRDGDSWWVIDAATGDVRGRIQVEHGQNYAPDNHPIGGVGPHNTWINRDGSRVYMEVLTVPYVFIADTRTNQLLGKVGPFSKGVRPFVVTDDEKYVFANVDWLLGFEIGEVKARDGKWGGKMIYRVEARTPAERLAQIPNPPARKPHSTPSHGIGLRPDQKEVWVVDGVYGYVYVYDVTALPPKHIASVALFKDPSEQPHPGWVSFSIDGHYAYPDGGAVIDTTTKQVIARIPTTEKLIEIQFRDGKPIKAGHR